jgi:hypothetical protein
MEYPVVFRRVGFFFRPATGAGVHRRDFRPVCFGPLRMEKITMRHSMTGSRNVQPNGVPASRRWTIRRVSSVLTVAAVLAAAPAFAKDPAPPSSKAPAVHPHAQPESAAIPECLEKLKLTAAQETQIKEIVHNYDASIGVVWKQFSSRYMQAICMETTLLAAIEDTLTESQRNQVHQQRRKTAQHEKVIAATSTKVNQATVTPNEETTKPATAAEEGLASVGVSLTDAQEATAEKIQDKYRTQLRSLNRDIQGLHTQLVSLEADKLVEIEKVLTKDQLAQLRMSRQNAPDAPKVATIRTEPTKTE